MRLVLEGVAVELGGCPIVAEADLVLASAYCDRLYVMTSGRLVASGPPDDVLTPEHIAEFFGVHAHRWAHPLTGRPILAFDDLDTVSAHSSANGAGP